MLVGAVAAQRFHAELDKGPRTPLIDAVLEPGVGPEHTAERRAIEAIEPAHVGSRERHDLQLIRGVLTPQQRVLLSHCCSPLTNRFRYSVPNSQPQGETVEP